MGISDSGSPMRPHGRIGSIINVVASAILGAGAVIVAIVDAQPFLIVVGIVFWTMCLFGFVPIMKRAKRYEQEQREQTQAARREEPG